MTSLIFRETIFASLLLWGNGYARIIRGADGTITYRYTNENGSVKEYGGKDIFHISGFSLAELKGISTCVTPR